MLLITCMCLISVDSETVFYCYWN